MYFAILCLYRASSCINTAPPAVAPGLQRVACTIPEGYGGSHPAKTRCENAMPCLPYRTRVDGMPPHSNDAEGIMHNVPKQCMDAHVQFKGPRGMGVAPGKMATGASARPHGMPVSRAAAYAPADPEWNAHDGPTVGPGGRERHPAGMPPGGARSGAG